MRANDSRPVRTQELRVADSYNALLRIKWADKKAKNTEDDASSPSPYAKITIDANGSTGSKLIVLLNIGASATDYTQYQFSAYATGITDPDGIDSSPTHTQCTTLGALITALNAVNGIWATRLHAPADFSLDNDDFIDLAETSISPLFTEVLYRDSSAVVAGSSKTWALRIGVPESIKGKIGAGRLEMLRVSALVNSNSDTDCILKVSHDPDEVDATKEVELAYTKAIADNVWTAVHDFTDGPAPVENGPLLVEITSTTTLTDGGKVIVQYRSAEV